ncbi:MAG: DUF2071 domain-containing protein [Verrucomicrobiota bacterium]
MSPSLEQRLALRVRPNGSPVMRQRWSGLLFLHWPVDPTLIAERLPAGLHVDTFEGQAWLGVVPFFMDRVRPVGLPPVPGLSWFMELNVRTYVHDDSGNAGVWFFSLDCNQPLAVEIARRAFHLPYEHAVMRSVRTGNRIEYHSRRKAIGALDAEFVYEMPTATRAAEPNSLEWFLVERYLLFSANAAGGIFTGRVHHAPYQIAPAICERLSTEPLRLNGFPMPTEVPPSVLTAAPVEVKIFRLRRVAV